jgi:acyl-CoA thioesterase-1
VGRNRIWRLASGRWGALCIAILAVAAALAISASLPDGPPTPEARASVPAKPDQHDPTAMPDNRFRLPSKPTVLFSGDSLSDGWHATEEKFGFKAMVAASILNSRPKAQFIDAHKAGFTVQRVASTFPVPSHVDLAVVELGTNDVSGREKTPPSTFRKQYADYLNSILTKSPNAELICVGTFAPADEGSDAIDAIIKRTCGQHGGSYVDLTSTFAAEGLRGPAGRRTWAGAADLGHPNDAGHRRIADMVLAMIARG